MTNEEMSQLVNKYFNVEGYTFPDHFEHRVDADSSAVIYSMVRENKPTNVLQIGCWEGGTTSVIMAALLKNEKPFNFLASEILSDKVEHTALHCVEKNNQSPIIIGDITKSLDRIPEKVDFLYHDTDHDFDTTKWVLDNIFPKLKEGALVIFHDWAVEDKDGKWIAKGGAWPETEYMIKLHEEGKLPLEKVYWNYHNPGQWETGVFTYKKL